MKSPILEGYARKLLAEIEAGDITGALKTYLKLGEWLLQATKVQSEWFEEIIQKLKEVTT